MSHRISMERARAIQENEMQARELIRLGKPYHSKRHKKSLQMRNKQDGFLKRLKERIVKTGGKLPEHLKTVEEEQDGL